MTVELKRKRYPSDSFIYFSMPQSSSKPTRKRVCVSRKNPCCDLEVNNTDSKQYKLTSRRTNGSWNTFPVIEEDATTFFSSTNDYSCILSNGKFHYYSDPDFLCIDQPDGSYNEELDLTQNELFLHNDSTHQFDRTQMHSNQYHGLGDPWTKKSNIWCKLHSTDTSNCTTSCTSSCTSSNNNHFKFGKSVDQRVPLAQNMSTQDYQNLQNIQNNLDNLSWDAHSNLNNDELHYITPTKSSKNSTQGKSSSNDSLNDSMKDIVSYLQNQFNLWKGLEDQEDRIRQTHSREENSANVRNQTQMISPSMR